MVIDYNPNFFLDAWKVGGVTLTLNFKDQNGTPMTKIVKFPGIDKLLNNSNKVLKCTFSSTGIDWANAGVEVFAK